MCEAENQKNKKIQEHSDLLIDECSEWFVAVSNLPET